jgi:hypothetical protein
MLDLLLILTALYPQGARSNHPRSGGSVFSLPVDATFHGVLTGAAVAEAIGTTADVVAAIVTYHDGTQVVTQYAPYTLTVNCVTQPGGEAPVLP